MATATATPSTTREIARTRSVWQIVGIVISVVIGAFLAFDVVGKLTRPEAVVEGTAKLGFPLEQTYVMGVVLLICLVVYAIPRTAVLGALGITAYLGGAVTANLRIESPLVSATLFAVYVGVLMWVGLVLRRPELLKVVGLRK
ncbi:DoxX family protein [Gordonia sp. SID5947]|uniref:DoxX family protein n=1 Tax=Gordonia sp. SID5947 TaxID=2690315 RepID=UPI00136C7137|nr:DoxX family protein [Gordonia sp. SID5947]MYR07231.1 DoxX family protein [Gordonia sp. SID5947]